MAAFDRKLRRFRPTGKGGGSRKGKPQGIWPWIVKVVADGVLVRSKGGDWRNMLIDRQNELTVDQFEEQMDILLPGWRGVIIGTRKTRLGILLMNRVYKMYYSGTSDRGPDHNIFTRPTMSKEHWTKEVPVGHDYHKIHADILSSKITTVKDWKKYL